MRNSEDMFPAPKVKRKRSRRNMHAIDAGPGAANQVMALMECQTCGHDGGWWEFGTYSEAKRGIPCPVCNKQVAQRGGEG